MATVRTTCEIYSHKFIVLLYSPLQLCNEVRLAAVAVAVTVTVDVAAAVPPSQLLLLLLVLLLL